jgi:hypothetical protein
LPAVLLIDSQGHEIDRIDQYLDVDAFLVRLGAAQAKLGRGEQARTP